MQSDCGGCQFWWQMIFLQMIWSYWAYQIATFCLHWDSLKQSVKQLEWPSTHQSLSLWLTARKRWIVHSGLGKSCCPMQGSWSIFFTSKRKMKQEIDRQGAYAGAQTLYRSAVVRKELTRKTKLSIYRSIYNLTSLVYNDHKLWVMTLRMR